jgi:hypothetical protein
MKMEEIANPYIDSFLERNSFKNVCPNKWANEKCLVTVLEDCYQIQFTNFDGDWEMFTDSWSIYHLVGILTWHDLLDRNYSK